MTTETSRIICPAVFVFKESIGEFSLALAFALFLCALQSGLNISHGEDVPVGDIAYQPGVIVQTPFPSFGPPLEQESPEPQLSRTGPGAASIDAAPAPKSKEQPQSEEQKNTHIDPGPILAALWRGEPDTAQRRLDEQESQGRLLAEDVRSLLADLLPAMAAQKSGNWPLATTGYGRARNRVRRGAASFAPTIEPHVTLLFWLNFAMLRYAEEDYPNARENLQLSRPRRVPDMTGFERAFHGRVAVQVASLASKQRKGKANGKAGNIPSDAEAKTVPAPAADPADENAARILPPLATIPEMVTVPAGRFLMGDIQGGGYEDELPVREVVIPHAFSLGRYEVTNREYVAFLNRRKPSVPELRRWIKTRSEEPASRIERLGNVYQVRPGHAWRPVVNVSWFGALAYVNWIAGRTGQPFRLPSEAEWEYAARAGTETRYWWGNQVGRNLANCDGCGSRWDGRETAPAGTFSGNAFGLHDVHGNVWEWVHDCADNGNYKSAPADGSARKSRKCKSRILRGGGWNRKPWYARSAARHRLLPDARSPAVGFRLARDRLSSGK